MTKEALLDQLRQFTYITLKASGIHGIGVFAACAIPKGCRDMFSKGIEEWIKLPVTEVEQLPTHARELVETYCLFDEEHYFVPSSGFNVIDPVIYLNHSSTPNIISINDGEYFEAITDIAPGEELLVNYTSLAEGLESYDH